MNAKQRKTAEIEVERLKRENAELKAKMAQGNELSFKVSAKGAVSVYGLGRFPVTLYQEQWERVLDRGEDIRDFIKANKKQLKVKGEE